MRVGNGYCLGGHKAAVGEFQWQAPASRQVPTGSCSVQAEAASPGTGKAVLILDTPNAVPVWQYAGRAADMEVQDLGERSSQRRGFDASVTP